MKYKFPLLALVFIILVQSISAQEYKMPRWGIRGSLDGLLIGQTNQGSEGLAMIGPAIDFNFFDNGLIAVNARSGLLLVHTDAGSIGFPLELDLLIHDESAGFVGGFGIVRQSGEAFWKEKSSVPTVHAGIQIMRPNRSFYCRFELRTVALPRHNYHNNQWTDYPRGGGGVGLSVSFGGFLGKWKSTELK